MEQSFDLDVNNYSTSDLLNFFKLDMNYSLEDLTKREFEIISELLSNQKQSKYTSKYKFDIINFIKTAKENLIGIKKQLETMGEVAKEIVKSKSYPQDPTVGKIINPLSSHQTMNVNINPPDSVDGYAYEKITSVYVFNTAARNDFFTTTASHAVFDLPLIWSNVISMTLTSANIPNVMFAFNKEYGTNQIYIEETGSGLSGIVTLPEGNYVPYSLAKLSSLVPIDQASFVDTLTIAINSQLNSYDASGNGRFLVRFDASNYSMTISNSTYNFVMSTIVKEPSDLCNPYGNTIFNDPKYNVNITNKLDVNLTTYVQTMGYQMGYRKIYYDASNSYTTESVFNNSYSNYLYFSLDDFTGSQTSSNTYGIVGPGLLSQNILGVIPISSSVFKTTFDSNANFIYKKREYFGPVNIARISIKLLNQRGNLVNLRGTDYSFALEIKSVYNLTTGKTPVFRGGGPF
jgi:hypothetical protein